MMDVGYVAGIVADEARDLASRFAEVVAAHGDRPAVVSGETQLSYRQLHLAANLLAWAIAGVGDQTPTSGARDQRSEVRGRRSQVSTTGVGGQASGGGRQDARGELDQDIATHPPVALLCAHDAGLIVAILGVLKAGRPYAALQGSEPPARLATLLDYLRAELIVCDAENLALAQTLAQQHAPAIKVLCLGQDMAGQSEDDLPATIAPEDLAVVSFTSGSTGEPKGVMRSHRVLLHRVQIDRQLKGVGCEDRIAFLFAASYGASQADLFGALMSGAALCLYDLRRQGLALLADWINAAGLTRLHLPVELFRQWLEILPSDAYFPTLLEVAPAGRMFRQDLEKARPHLPAGCKIITRLSSGETNLISQMAIDVHAPILDDVIPVGRLVPDLEIYLLDEAGEPAVPTGGDRVGEIVVTSQFLSPGYWRRPDLTANAFSDDPLRPARRTLGTTFSDDPGWRRFRTGDWVLMRADGVLEFHGRRDQRVKVRGHTVELSAVEAALASLPEVGGVAVIAQEMSDGGKRLVAFVVPASGDAATLNPPTDSDLRAALTRFLPSYMIPAVFLRLDALPLNANNKVDRRSLLDLAPLLSARPALPTDYLAPRNETEAELAQIWAEVLGIDQVGVDDYFLDLGGNSLMAARIAARVMRDFPSQPISMTTLFAVSTVAHMAALFAPWKDRESSGLEALLAEVEALSDEDVEAVLTSAALMPVG